MPDITLTAKAPLNGFQKDYGNVHVREVTDRAVVSLATPDEGKEALSAAIAAAYQTRLPDVGQSTTSDTDHARFLGLQQQQAFLICDTLAGDPVSSVESRLNGTAYLTDQTDSWVLLEVSGAQAITALERICPIDLHPSIFTINSVARTAMEHLGVIIVRTGEDEYLLMSACSSAQSFLHAVETSISNVN